MSNKSLSLSLEYTEVELQFETYVARRMLKVKSGQRTTNFDWIENFHHAIDLDVFNHGVIQTEMTKQYQTSQILAS